MQAVASTVWAWAYIKRSFVRPESEKAAMEVPAAAGGRVSDVRVHVGDKVSRQGVLASVEVAEAGEPALAVSAPSGAASTLAPGAAAAAAQPTGAGGSQDGRSTAAVELNVPDIGDFHDVPMLEVLVAPGESVPKDALRSESAPRVCGRAWARMAAPTLKDRSPIFAANERSDLNAGERAADRSGDDAAPVQVGAAEDIPAARDRDGQAVGGEIAARQQIRAALRDVVGMTAGYSYRIRGWTADG